MEYLLVCRSITYAQKMNTALMSEGINSRIVRTPVGAASESCGYSVKIDGDDREVALRILRRVAIMPKKLLRRLSDGQYMQEAM